MAQRKNSSFCVFHFVLDSVSLMNGASARCRSALILYLTLSLSHSTSVWQTDCSDFSVHACAIFFFFFFWFIISCACSRSAVTRTHTNTGFHSSRSTFLLTSSCTTVLALGLLLHSGLLDTRFNDDFYGFFFFPEAIFPFWLGGGSARGDDGAPPPPALKNSPTELTQSVFSFLSIAVASFSGGWNHETAPPRLDFYCCFKVVLFLVCLLYISIDLVMGFRLQCNCVFFIF